MSGVRDIFSAWLLYAYRRPRRFLLSLVILPLAAVLVVTFQVNVSLWRKQSLHNLGVAAHLAAQIVTDALNDTFQFEQLIIAQPGFREAVRARETAKLGQFLQASVPFVPHADLALVVSPAGDVIAAYPEGARLSGRSVVEEEAFRGARAGGWHPYVSAVYLREGGEMEKVVSLSLPISSEGTVVGLLQLQYRVETVKSWLQKIRVEPDGFLYVVDHRDQLVVYPFQVLPGRPKIVSSWPPVSCALPSDGTSLVFRGGRVRAQWLAGVYPVTAAGWRVVAVQPERAAFRPLWHVFFNLGLLIAALAALVITVTWRWAKLQAFNLRLLQQNTELLKKFQQRQTLK